MRIRPGVAVCLVLTALGAVAAVIGIARFGDAEDRIAGYPAVPAGEVRELTLEAGELVGWYEGSCFGCRGRESVSLAPRLSVDGAAAVSVSPFGDQREARYDEGGFLDYSTGDVEGGPAYELDVPKGGRYEVRVGPASEPGAAIRIGPSVEGMQIGAIVIAVAGFVVGGGALLVLLAWGLSIMLRDATRQ